MGSKNNHFWSSITDLMSGLMIIFVLIAVVFMAEMKLILEEVIYVTEGFQDTEKSLYNELMKEFKNDLEDWNAYIDAKHYPLFLKNQMFFLKKVNTKLKNGLKSFWMIFFQGIHLFLKTSSLKIIY